MLTQTNAKALGTLLASNNPRRYERANQSTAV